jgi:diguanylate cyclase (GGDEF)-like protein
MKNNPAGGLAARLPLALLALLVYAPALWAQAPPVETRASGYRRSIIEALIFSALLGIVAWNHYRMRKRAEIEIQKKNEEILGQKRLLEEQARQIELANRVLGEAALTDPLTGLRNRRFYSLLIESEVARITRARAGEGAGACNQDLLFYLLDIDRLKSINDRHGQEAGDQVLVETAVRLLAAVRKSDYVFRWGGGEFLVLSRETERASGASLAERILKAISSEPIALRNGEQLMITPSVGWAPFPWDGDVNEVTPEEVIALADRALFLAKEGGRNRALGAVPSWESITGMPAEIVPSTRKRALFIDSKSAPV